MFTGLVERMGTVRSVRPAAHGARLEIDAAGWPPRAQSGESIAVDGCCLTLVSAESGSLAFDVVPQTLSRTTLGGWAPGRRVNLERSATPSTLLGGHLVQGHVDGVGRVESVTAHAGDWRVRFLTPPEVAPFVAARGSIAVNGVSLTVADVTAAPSREAAADPSATIVTVALIPETLERTNLAMLDAGHEVNLEADAIARLVDAAVRRVLAERGGG